MVLGLHSGLGSGFSAKRPSIFPTLQVIFCFTCKSTLLPFQHRTPTCVAHHPTPPAGTGYFHEIIVKYGVNYLRPLTLVRGCGKGAVARAARGSRCRANEREWTGAPKREQGLHPNHNSGFAATYTCYTSDTGNCSCACRDSRGCLSGRTQNVPILLKLQASAIC